MCANESLPSVLLVLSGPSDCFPVYECLLMSSDDTSLRWELLADSFSNRDLSQRFMCDHAGRKWGTALESKVKIGAQLLDCPFSSPLSLWLPCSVNLNWNHAVTVSLFPRRNTQAAVPTAQSGFLFCCATSSSLQWLLVAKFKRVKTNAGFFLLFQLVTLNPEAIFSFFLM